MPGEDYIAEFSKEYIGKLFYFCLKKTGNTHEAEELSAEITMHIISALRRGTQPRSFPAWVWRIARNRYSRWAENKHSFRKNSMEAELCSDSPEDGLIRAEELSLLRRELAFTVAEYRRVVVAYYIEDRSVKDIAKSLSLSENTVKSKLYRARNILKEGMNMAREFGAKSYKPESVGFSATGRLPSGLPWSAVNRKIPNNILLAASNNPSTAEELAMELGVALPYMEEEIELLVEATLLKKVGGKYVTNFLIESLEIQREVYRAVKNNSEARSAVINEIAEDCLPAIRGLVYCPLTDEELKWWVVLDLVDQLINNIKGYDGKWPVRDNGEDWGFMGYENTINELCEVVGCNCMGNEKVFYQHYTIKPYGLRDRIGELGYVPTLLLGDIISRGRRIDSLSASEAEHWKQIEKGFAHADSEGNVIPDIMVIEGDNWNKIHELYKSHPCFNDMRQSFQSVFEELIEIFRKYGGELFCEQIACYAYFDIYHLRTITIKDEVESGRLIVPTEPDRSAIAMCIEVK
ncbi:MAG: sigma-70 family RNA polymerase sigma factor [Oscillospiraceae bacterium]|nr:sigma-70 family RNA polymerase sigma factor [Oscillospiraceae bacterium]